jgi:nucleoside-diphosphate-sugar epimerase
MIEATATEGAQPTVHFASGTGTTLGALAQLASAMALAPVSILESPPRSYDVARFVGDTRLAERLLGWRATRGLVDGVGELIRDLAHSGPA